MLKKLYIKDQDKLHIGSKNNQIYIFGYISLLLRFVTVGNFMGANRKDIVPISKNQLPYSVAHTPLYMAVIFL